MLWNILYKHGWYNQRNIWKKGVETIVDKDRILWLNEKHTEEGLHHKKLPIITKKIFLKL